MTQTYRGSCHCGDNRYSVELDLQEAARCNCSICRRAGWLLAFAPEESFALETTLDSATDYQFGHKRAHHYFCKRCGIRSFGKGTMPDGAKVVSINLRCLDDVDLDALAIKEYDGASL